MPSLAVAKSYRLWTMGMTLPVPHKTYRCLSNGLHQSFHYSTGLSNRVTKLQRLRRQERNPTAPIDLAPASTNRHGGRRRTELRSRDQSRCPRTPPKLYAAVAQPSEDLGMVTRRYRSKPLCAADSHVN